MSDAPSAREEMTETLKAELLELADRNEDEQPTLAARLRKIASALAGIARPSASEQLKDEDTTRPSGAAGTEHGNCRC